MHRSLTFSLSNVSPQLAQFSLKNAQVKKRSSKITLIFKISPKYDQYQTQNRIKIRPKCSQILVKVKIFVLFLYYRNWPSFHSRMHKVSSQKNFSFLTHINCLCIGTHINNKSSKNQPRYEYKCRKK